MLNWWIAGGIDPHYLCNIMMILGFLKCHFILLTYRYIAHNGIFSHDLMIPIHISNMYFFLSLLSYGFVIFCISKIVSEITEWSLEGKIFAWLLPGPFEKQYRKGWFPTPNSHLSLSLSMTCWRYIGSILCTSSWGKVFFTYFMYFYISYASFIFIST